MSQRTVFRPIDFKTRFPALDGIRALAVTFVFLDHYAGGSHGGFLLNAVNIVRQRLWIGVDLFFVLSGFLITGILYDTRHDSHFFKRFYARRSLRIFPVYYGTALVLLLLTPFLKLVWQPRQAWFLLYMGNWIANSHFELYDIPSLHGPAWRIFIGHLWSLCVEEQFYLLWPPLVWLVRDRIKLIWVAAGASLAALALRWWWCLHIPDPDRWIIRALPFRVDTLLFGALLALVLRGPNADAWQRAMKWVFLLGTAVSVAIFAVSRPQAGILLMTVGLSAIAAASTGLIGMTLVEGSRTFRFFYWKPARLLGKYSYGYYIFNRLFGPAWVALLVVLMRWTHSMAIAGAIALPLNYILTFIVAKLSYDWFEVRFLRWKKNFEYDSELSEHKHAFVTK